MPLIRASGEGRLLDQVPMTSALQELGYKARMERMTGFVGYQTSEHGTADQGKVTQQIEDFVPYKFVGKAQRRVIQHAVLCQYDCVFQRTSADQTVRLELFNVVIVAKGASRRD